MDADAARLVLLGPPACGKGTQGRRLARARQRSYFSTGKQLRREVSAGSSLGAEVGPYLSRNEYVPDRLAMALATAWLEGETGGWILDGFPRTKPQALAFDEILGEKNPSLRALFLDVDRDELAERVAQRRECGQCCWVGTRAEAEMAGRCPTCAGPLMQRKDDAPESFQKRVAVFEQLTLPVVDYYAQSGRLVRVSGVGSPEEVFTRVERTLRNHG